MIRMLRAYLAHNASGMAYGGQGHFHMRRALLGQQQHAAGGEAGAADGVHVRSTARSGSASLGIRGSGAGSSGRRSAVQGQGQGQGARLHRRLLQEEDEGAADESPPSDDEDGADGGTGGDDSGDKASFDDPYEPVEPPTAAGGDSGMPMAASPPPMVVSEPNQPPNQPPNTPDEPTRHGDVDLQPVGGCDAEGGGGAAWQLADDAQRLAFPSLVGNAQHGTGCFRAELSCPATSPPTLPAALPAAPCARCSRLRPTTRPTPSSQRSPSTSPSTATRASRRRTYGAPWRSSQVRGAVHAWPHTACGPACVAAPGSGTSSREARGTAQRIATQHGAAQGAAACRQMGGPLCSAAPHTRPARLACSLSMPSVVPTCNASYMTLRSAPLLCLLKRACHLR